MSLYLPTLGAAEQCWTSNLWNEDESVKIGLIIAGIKDRGYLVAMKSFSPKLRLIYYPFLLIAAGFIVAYSILNGWLTIGTTTIPLKEPVTDLWLPLVLPFILLAIWLRPRIGLLNLKT